jgi:hypothetical protein
MATGKLHAAPNKTPRSGAHGEPSMDDYNAAVAQMAAERARVMRTLAT